MIPGAEGFSRQSTQKWETGGGRRGDFFQVMNFETGVVSIKIAVLRGSSVK